MSCFFSTDHFNPFLLKLLGRDDLDRFDARVAGAVGRGLRRHDLHRPRAQHLAEVADALPEKPDLVQTKVREVPLL